MKFLCDNCKAKYQIADEKVTGRTVRMKCRKCGHLIEIRAISDGQGATEAAPVESAAPAPARVAPAPTPRPSAPSAARPGASASSAPVATAAPKAGAPRPGGLASAFNKAVVTAPTSSERASASDPLDDAGWFAGIGGSPIGPMSGDDFRARVSSGALTEETLVWRDGLDEWGPARAYPELVEVIRALRPAPSRSSSSIPAARVSRPAPAPSPRGNVIPLHSRAATAEKLEPETPEPEGEDGATLYMPGAAAKLRESLSPPAVTPATPAPRDGRVPAVMADPFAVADPFASQQAQAPLSAPTSALNPMLAPLPTPAAARLDTYDEPRPAPARGGIPLAGWAAIVLALGAGLAGGALLFKTDPPKSTIQYVTVSAPLPDAPVGSVAMGNNPNSADPGTVDPKTGVVRPTGGGKPNPKETKDPTGKVAPIDLGPSLGDVPNVQGGGSPTSANSDANKPGAVDAGAIQRVLNNSKGTLKRACLDAYSAVIKPGSSVSVTINLMINPDGGVGSANVTGGAGVPGLAACVASRAKGWRFPEAQGPTQTSPTLTWVF